MFKVNDNYLKLPGSYLFSTIAKKVNAFTAANPQAEIIRLGIGDVTQPIAPAVIEALHKAVDEQSTTEGFKGYAPDLGYAFLRETIAKNDYEAYGCERMKFLYPTVQRAILQIFRRFSLWTIKLRYVIRFTRFMWIPTLWQAEPALTIRKVRPGGM